jgi:ribonuclease R
MFWVILDHYYSDPPKAEICMARKSKKGGSFLFEDILHLLENHPGKAWNYKQVAAELKAHSNDDRATIQQLLDDLVEKGMVEIVDRGKYRIKSGDKIVTGVLDMTASGAAYVSTAELEQDVFIAPRNTYGSFHGDTVAVQLFRRRKAGAQEEGEVVQIVKRGRTEFVATLEIENRVAFGITDNKKYPDFIIPKDKIGNAKDGQKVVVRFTDWEDYSDLPRGEVASVLGEPGDNNTEINAIMVEYGLPYEFPKDVERVASLIPTEITEEEIAKRRDFRTTTTFTIDPFDAKDFDDALSIKKLDNGHWEIGVHIADVSHYLHTGTLLDKEAIARATSVYLVDRVVPMLPEVLSNFVCSLRPNEEKLTFSAVFDMDEEGTIHNEWFGRTVINSARRFTYEEVQEIIEGAEGDFRNEILVLNTIAKQLRNARLAKGSLTFDKAEVKFHLDEAGNPTGVYFKVMKDSNQLIEDFMLLANRRVAEYVTLQRKAGEKPKKQTDNRRPFVYRIHATPNPDKISEFSNFVSTFGYKLNAGSDSAIAQSLNKLLKDVQGKPEANMIETLAIRTMAKAVYSTNNIGHYGLGFQFYTHFTSPIRRYPDVLAHRLLQLYLDRDAGKTKELPPDIETLEEECKHCSEREKLAAEAERASIKYKQVQFLQDKIGQIFPALISGVTEFGFFAELEGNKCEGMVHVRNLKDDRYVFEQENYRLRGLRNGRMFMLGDTVYVRVKSADLLKKQIDFDLVDGEESAPRSKGEDGPRKSRSSDEEEGGKFHPTKPQLWNPGDESGSGGNRKTKNRGRGGPRKGKKSR